ncbi:TPA: DNA-binding response regulator, partial [Escherichia coli]|nr:DNA-binding response regulator [Escherichia coli]
MKVLIIDECFFTRNGIKHYFEKRNVRHEIIDMPSIQEANN